MDFEFKRSIFPNYTIEMWDGNAQVHKGNLHVNGGNVDVWNCKYGNAETYKDDVNYCIFYPKKNVSISITHHTLCIKSGSAAYSNDGVYYGLNEYQELPIEKVEKILSISIPNCKLWSLIKKKAKELVNQNICPVCGKRHRKIMVKTKEMNFVTTGNEHMPIESDAFYYVCANKNQLYSDDRLNSTNKERSIASKSAVSVANLILCKANSDKISITLADLNSILYLMQKEAIKNGKLAFEDEIKACESGVYIDSVVDKFWQYQGDPIRISLASGEIAHWTQDLESWIHTAFSNFNMMKWKCQSLKLEGLKNDEVISVAYMRNDGKKKKGKKKN